MTNIVKSDLNDEQKTKIAKELEDIYTPLEEAKEEIWKRWNNKELKKEIENYLGKNIPKKLLEKPKVALGRHVISPNFELFHFLEQTKKTDLFPVCLGYSHDIFIARNIDKYFLCNMLFYDGIGKNGGKRIKKIKTIDFNGAEGKKLKEIETIYGKNLVEFHYDLVSSLNLNSQIENIDLSDFLKEKGFEAKKYYPYYLSFFLCHGILFENYLLNKDQIEFTNNVVKHFKKVYNKFKIKPLIVKLGPIGDEENLYWRHYPKIVENKIKELYQNNKQKNGNFQFTHQVAKLQFSS